MSLHLCSNQNMPSQGPGVEGGIPLLSAGVSLVVAPLLSPPPFLSFRLSFGLLCARLPAVSLWPELCSAFILGTTEGPLYLTSPISDHLDIARQNRGINSEVTTPSFGKIGERPQHRSP